jgi:hypothetical protein
MTFKGFFGKEFSPALSSPFASAGYNGKDHTHWPVETDHYGPRLL